MRACGAHEEEITGNESEWEKFYAWAETVPKTVRNPLYHWTHMELAKPFGIRDRLLNAETADEIWEACNEMLAYPEFTRSEEHTSELQSRGHLVCRLLLEKKKNEISHRG